MSMAFCAVRIARPLRPLTLSTAEMPNSPASLLAPDLPLDRARGTSRRHTAAWVLDEDATPLGEGLLQAAERANATPHAWLLAVFVALLSRYTRESEFLVSVVFDREGAASRVPVRLAIDPGRAFTDLVRATQTAVEAAAGAQPPDAVEPALAFDVSDLDPAQGANGTTPYELGLVVRPRGAALGVAALRAAELLDEASALGWARHYRRLLESSIASPGAACAALDALGDDERQKLLVEWNRNDAPAPPGSLHRMVERHAATRPDASAIVFDGGRRLTYRELDQQANRLAHTLRSRGVGPEAIVGLCLERSPEMIVAELAVLKSGGAFLPLDAGYPPDRLAFMVEDSGTRLLVVSGATRHLLRESGVDRLDLEAAAAELSASPSTPPVLDDDPERLAYVIYTSGSTGRPKGVQVPHRGIGNLGRWLAEAWESTRSSQHLLFASFSFDAAVADTAVAFSAGATLHLASAEAQFPGAPLARLLEERGITHVCLPPSTLAVLGCPALPKLRTIAVAGEACSAEIVARWAPGRRLVEQLRPHRGDGLRHAGVCAADDRRPSIGRPLRNAAPTSWTSGCSRSRRRPGRAAAWAASGWRAAT